MSFENKFVSSILVPVNVLCQSVSVHVCLYAYSNEKVVIGQE